MEQNIENSIKRGVIAKTLSEIRLTEDMNVRVFTSGAMLKRKELADGQWAWIMDESIDDEFLGGEEVNLDSSWGAKEQGVMFEVEEIERELIGSITKDGGVVTNIKMSTTTNKPVVYIFAKNLGEVSDKGDTKVVPFDEVEWAIMDEEAKVA